MAFPTRFLFLVCGALLGTGCATDSVSREPARWRIVEHERVPRAEPLARLVLVLREGKNGQGSAEWVAAERFDLADYPRASSGARGDVVFAAMRPRDCHAEYLECHAKCMSRPLPRGYGHMTERGRGRGAKDEYCNNECLRSYRDCEEAQGRQVQEFSTGDEAVGWLAEHRRSLFVGSVVVIAGVVFVTVSAGAGLLVLVPAMLLTGVDPALTPRAVAVRP